MKPDAIASAPSPETFDTGSTLEPAPNRKRGRSMARRFGQFECIGQGRSAWCKKAELSDSADSETPRRLLMQPMYYIGLDVHKQKISYCVKESGGQVFAEGWIPATRFDLDRWRKTLPQPWSAALEATMFSGWIYDQLKPHAAELKVAHPLMLRAIAAAKKKNDRIDANKICDCLRCDFLPESYMAPTAIRERRRTLRYRNLLVRQMVQMKIKISMLLMEAGVSYNKQKLHKAGYFRELLASNPDVDPGLRSLLRQCRETVVRLSKTERPHLNDLCFPASKRLLVPAKR